MTLSGTDAGSAHGRGRVCAGRGLKPGDEGRRHGLCRVEADSLQQPHLQRLNRTSITAGQTAGQEEEIIVRDRSFSSAVTVAIAAVAVGVGISVSTTRTPAQAPAL